jgi:hypothetical protein
MHPPSGDHPLLQLFWLLVLAIPISCLAWTVTHEEIFRELRDYCGHRSALCRSVWARKFFYLFTCEYCFSHWVTLAALFLTRFKLLLDDWRGYVLSLFALVWLANVYMSLYGRLRVDITSERAEAKAKEKEAEKLEAETEAVKSANGSNGDAPPPGEDHDRRQPVDDPMRRHRPSHSSDRSG